MLGSVTRERRDYLGFGRGRRFVLAPTKEGGIILKAYEARRGTMVRIREGHWKTEFGGMYGTIQDCWGNSEYAAVDVLLEDGRLEFFWLPNLEEIEEDIAV
jgi:hypothetical protein